MISTLQQKLNFSLLFCFILSCSFNLHAKEISLPLYNFCNEAIELQNGITYHGSLNSTNYMSFEGCNNQDYESYEKVHKFTALETGFAKIVLEENWFAEFDVMIFKGCNSISYECIGRYQSDDYLSTRGRFVFVEKGEEYHIVVAESVQGMDGTSNYTIKVNSPDFCSLSESDILCQEWLIDSLYAIDFNDVDLSVEKRGDNILFIQLGFGDKCYSFNCEGERLDDDPNSCISLEQSNSCPLWNYQNDIVFDCWGNQNCNLEDLFCLDWATDTLGHYEEFWDFNCSDDSGASYSIYTSDSGINIIRLDENPSTTDSGEGRFYTCDGKLLGTSETTLEGTQFNPTFLSTYNLTSMIWNCNDVFPECNCELESSRDIVFPSDG